MRASEKEQRREKKQVKSPVNNDAKNALDIWAGSSIMNTITR